MHTYLFFFGRSPELAMQELSVFFPQARLLRQDIALVEAQSFQHNGKEKPMEESLTVLGGSVKVAKILGTVDQVTPEILLSFLLMDRTHRIDFGISSYVDDFHVSPSLLRSVKDGLEQEGVVARFLTTRHGEVLSSVAVSKQHVVELNIVLHDGKYMIAKTVAIQEYEAWNKRDYGRPYADPKAGMLPPKISRIIATLALGTHPEGKTLVDPFCGMGTVLGEGSLLGATVIGSDYKQDVVGKAEANCAWLFSQYPYIQKPTFFVCDATHISEILPAHSIDGIATEPFMGTNKLGEGQISEPQKVRDILKGLGKLYLGCLKDWHGVLKSGGRIVMAVPEITMGKTVYTVKNVIDSCETLGYTLHNGSLPYGRPNATVKRMIYEFIKL